MKTKDKEKIQRDIKAIASDFMLNDFTTSKGYKPIKIDSINVVEITFDEEGEDRKSVSVTSFIAFSRVIVEFMDGTTTNDVLLKLSKPIPFILNPDTDEFEFKGDPLHFLDITER